MPMELDRRELKRQARARVRAADPPFWLLTLVFLLLTTGVSSAANWSGAAYLSLPPGPGDTVPLFLALLILLYTTVLGFGYQLWALDTFRQRGAGFGTLIDGFSMARRVLLMELNIFLCTLCWGVAIVMGLALLAQLLWGVLPPLALALVIYGGSLLGMLWISYRYILSPYLLMDHPERGPFAAVRESVARMRGWKWQLFKLDLSFLGWHLLNFLLNAAVTAVFAFPTLLEILQSQSVDPNLFLSGVPLPWYGLLLATLIQVPVTLWLKPYQAVAHAGFYQAMLQRQDAPPVWEPYDGPET